MAQGHYTSYVRLAQPGEQWFMCDDEAIHMATTAEVLSSEGYVPPRPRHHLAKGWAVHAALGSYSCPHSPPVTVPLVIPCVHTSLTRTWVTHTHTHRYMLFYIKRRLEYDS